jgi:hypothetical protein
LAFSFSVNRTFKNGEHKKSSIFFFQSHIHPSCNKHTHPSLSSLEKKNKKILPASLSYSNRDSRPWGHGQRTTYVPPSRIQRTPYLGFWRSEVHVLRLWIRFVRQDLASVISDDFGSCLLIWVCVFNDSRRSRPYIPFCLYRLSQCHMMSIQF